MRVQWREAEVLAWRSVGSPTSDRAVWGSSPDQPLWRGVIITRQRWPLVPTVFGPISKENAVERHDAGGPKKRPFMGLLAPVCCLADIPVIHLH